jgi:hypothetical protein
MPTFDPTSASRAVLIEVMNVLGVFCDKIVLVGGWVPDLLYPNSGFQLTNTISSVTISREL